MNRRVHIVGMHCNSCVRKVQAALSAMQDVQGVRVDLGRHIADIEAPREIPLDDIRAALSRAGSYGVQEYGYIRTFVSRALVFWPLVAAFTIVIAYATLRFNPFASSHALHEWMLEFMAAFFLVFGGLKIVSVRTFANTYATYDPIARRFPMWGYVYPWIEMALGFAYLLRVALVPAHIATIALLTVATVGIVRKIKSASPGTCACLGGWFSVPLTWFTVAENAIMIAMAIYMLAF